MPQDKVLIGDDMPAEEVVEEAVVEETPEVEAPAEQKLYMGKFKTPEDMEKSYSELEKKMGEQGNRLGEMEKDKSFLMTQLESMQAKNQEAPIDQGKADDFDMQLSAISKQVEDGDLSIGEGMQQAAKISALIAQNETVKGIKQEQSAAAIEKSKQIFAETNPDFFELQQSGALDEIKGKLPGFHDDVSAYYALKAEQNAAMVEAARAEGIAAGKAEMAKIADGDKNTQKVLQSGGKGAEQIGRKPGPVTGNKLIESGLAALQAARGG